MKNWVFEELGKGYKVKPRNMGKAAWETAGKVGEESYVSFLHNNRQNI